MKFLDSLSPAPAPDYRDSDAAQVSLFKLTPPRSLFSSPPHSRDSKPAAILQGLLYCVVSLVPTCVGICCARRGLLLAVWEKRVARLDSRAQEGGGVSVLLLASVPLLLAQAEKGLSPSVVDCFVPRVPTDFSFSKHNVSQDSDLSHL